MALIKCSECGKDVSSRAKACPHCGFPLEPTLPTPSLSRDMQPVAFVGNDAGATKGETKKILFVMFLIICGIFGVFIAEDDKAPSASIGSNMPVPSLPTKAEWRAKVASHYGQVAQMNMIVNWRVVDFKSIMGEPGNTQTDGDQAFWYYECSDGTIQLSMYAPNLAAGIMQGKINDY
jgi:hypothetical protein